MWNEASGIRIASKCVNLYNIKRTLNALFLTFIYANILHSMKVDVTYRYQKHDTRICKELVKR